MVLCMCVVVVVVEIITLYQVQTGRFLAATGYVAPSPNHVQKPDVPKEIRMYLNESSHQGKENTLQNTIASPLAQNS